MPVTLSDHLGHGLSSEPGKFAWYPAALNAAVLFGERRVQIIARYASNTLVFVYDAIHTAIMTIAR